MIRIENIDVHGWEAAIRGMRNPLNSWSKSDTVYGFTDKQADVGPNDLSLMQRLSSAGDDHGKFLRFITVTLDVTAPLYWWKEFDAYKVGTVANSCSTMHKIHAKQFVLDDFSTDKLYPFSIDALNALIIVLNTARDLYLETKDKGFWYQMIQLLPSSYNQKRTLLLNYQVLDHMYHARKNHKLDEWRSFCAWCETLPYFKEICLYGDSIE